MSTKGAKKEEEEDTTTTTTTTPWKDEEGEGVASRRRKEIDTLPHPISFLSFPSPHLPILLRGSEREHGAKAIFHTLICSRSFPAAVSVSVSVVSDQKTHSTSWGIAYGAVVPWCSSFIHGRRRRTRLFLCCFYLLFVITAH